MSHRICLVGYGAIAGYHAEALRGAGSEIAWVVGPRDQPRAEFATKWSARSHTADLETALADPDVDIVLIASPTDLHTEQASRSLRAGKHVLCEIPLATTYREYDALSLEAKALGLRLAVCHTHRYYPGQGYVRSRVQSGALHIHHIIYRHHMFRRENVGWTGYRRSWTDNLLWHHGGHVVDSCLWMLGAIEATVSAVGARPSGPLETIMDLSFTLRTPANELVTVSMSYNDHLRTNDLLIVGEETSLRISGEGGHHVSGPDGVVLPADEGRETLAAGLVRQDTDFLLAIDRDEEPPISAAAVEPTMRTLQAIQDAMDAAR